MSKKYGVLVAVLLVIMGSVLAACGDQPVTVGNSATTTAAPTTNPPTTTAAPPTTTAPATSPATTTMPTTTPAANSDDIGKKGEKLTAEAVVKKVYTDLQSGGFGRADKVLVSADLQAKVRAKGGLDNVLALAGVTKGQKIQSFTLGPTNGDNETATINVTLQLGDGKSVVNTVTVKKGNIGSKTGNDLNIWQVSKIEVQPA